MIKIMKYGQVPNSEIFARVVPAVNVEAVVSEIIAKVRLLLISVDKSAIFFLSRRDFLIQRAHISNF